MKFFIKIAIFSAVVILAQAILAVTKVRQPQILDFVRIDNSIKTNPDILYFGDSAIDSIASFDKEKLTIVELLSKASPARSIGDVSSGAYEMEMYESILRHIFRSKYRPKAIIIPASPGAFSPVFYMHPMFQFEKDKFFFNNSAFVAYFYNPLVIMGIINPNKITQAQFYQLPLFYGNPKHFEELRKIQIKNRDDLTPENIKDLYVYFYMYALNQDHPMIKSLERILNLSEKSGIKVFVYISPIKYRIGLKYVGADFVNQTNMNADFICSVLKQKNLPCLNLMNKLSNEYFDRKDNIPDKHLNERGRRFIAEQINKFLSDFGL